MKSCAVLFLASYAAGAIAAPCTDIDGSLTATESASFAPAVEAHLKAQSDPRLRADIQVTPDDVLHVFRFRGWYVVHVNNHATDDPYVFYSKRPNRASRYVAVWAGAAAAEDGPEIERWTVANAPGIPGQLAACFAWSVVQGL